MNSFTPTPLQRVAYAVISLPTEPAARQALE